MRAPVSRLLADALSSSTWAALPPAVVAETERAVMDWMGSAIAGAIEPPARMVQGVVRRLGTSSEATVFGAARASAAGAALANGVASHILEFDDVHKGSTLHGAAAVIPAALAVAEREHAHGQAFMLSVALGYEAALRVGEAVNPTHYRFWHPTGTAGTFGAAAAAGSLLRLDSGQMLDALGTAGTQAAGLWEFNTDGAMSKHLHPGKAAFNGVLAADLAREGFTGAQRILEGSRGFFEAMSTSYDESRILDGLGTVWKIRENCYKLHACCGHTHTAVDIALALRSAQRTPSLGVRAIHVETYGPGYEIVREPNPRTPYQAKFSIAYCVVVAFLEGKVGLAQFAPERFTPTGARDRATADLLSRTTVTVHDDLTAKYPGAWPARLTIVFDDDSVVTRSADYPRGNPENPVATAELEEKFLALVGDRFGAAVATNALEAVRSVGSALDVADTFTFLGSHE